ncbi:hypothetical protein CAPTEDRAFT_148596 [Capitella teleta]|uniref:Fork-head domain-containing protein n=1 Tax=Capitella teleta TaxID=283909 RepID=R7U312_CAPTE|nr:hypothetical protein CAPTEDRAFT_148596 [Capitella teleta]|eukprot:ELU00476.1 hypothetical protein CAPTEDRAFT_148596 [Capitella teleta]
MAEETWMDFLTDWAPDLNDSLVDPNAESENYGLQAIASAMEEGINNPDAKPNLSYIALIALAIQHSPNQRSVLSDIYTWMSHHFPYYDLQDRSWRNSVRHNLSLNECFVKTEKSEGGKGHFWTIHPACAEGFLQGDFRRRRARRIAKHSERLSCQLLENSADRHCPEMEDGSEAGFVTMTTTTLSVDYLVKTFGSEAIFGPPNWVNPNARGSQLQEFSPSGGDFDDFMFQENDFCPPTEYINHEQFPMW